ncbi:bifunctional 5,10-methylenetetrahydrofolate dehydrogenase/5,10-methenyltetrahydrofolate cyclohydrolase [Candidatus Peregrinibacteria bacterium]|nr:bifunctional 5,10-methylenetetrahydrofolate dehydrogenase/5,10-methenyltetrahydrofolate cyclohydrolase [Candidatus Peregrinibacteria bacterium]
MSATILDGNKAAEALLESLKPSIKKLKPKLVIVQIGKEAASMSYIKKKIETCAKIGLEAEHRELPFETPIDKLFQTIEDLNRDPKTTGFIIQLPLPPHLRQATPLVFRAIDPRKDVDGFTAYNLGKIFLSTEFETLPPATPAGIIALLEYYKIPIAGKHAVIVGRSNIVGKPLAIMLLNRDATVTVCHSKTSDLRQKTLDADLLVAAVGIPKFVTNDMVKKGAVVIDVGVNRTETEKIVGDTDFDAIKEIASAITPVPGGVGPMTVASLIRNVVRAKEQQKNT